MCPSVGVMEGGAGENRLFLSSSGVTASGKGERVGYVKSSGVVQLKA